MVHCHLYGRELKCDGFCWGNLKEGDHMGDLVIDGRIILELSIMK
jgi:hypothetical protein